MTQDEHLDRIVAKCRELLIVRPLASDEAKAGWRATIAAIEAIPMMEGGFTQYELAREIIAAWPEELI